MPLFLRYQKRFLKKKKKKKVHKPYFYAYKQNFLINLFDRKDFQKVTRKYIIHMYMYVTFSLPNDTAKKSLIFSTWLENTRPHYSILCLRYRKISDSRIFQPSNMKKTRSNATCHTIFNFRQSTAANTEVILFVIHATNFVNISTGHFSTNFIVSLWAAGYLLQFQNRIFGIVLKFFREIMMKHTLFVCYDLFFL